MNRNVLVRIALYVSLGVAAYVSPGRDGWPWSVDAWLWTGFRDIAGPNPRWLPLAVSAAMIVAEGLGVLLPSCAVRVRRPWRWVLGVALIGAAVLWKIRVKRWFGDFHDVDHQDLPWWTIEAAEPLGAFTTYYTEHWAAAAGVRLSTAIAGVSVACGAIALSAIFLWSRLVTDEWPLLGAMFASCAFMVMFYGYPEKGTPKSLALCCCYVYVTTRVLRERKLGLQLVSSLLLSLAGLMHGSALCWLPAHVWYVWRRTRWWRAAIGVLVFLAPIAAVIAYVRSGARYSGGPWGNVAAPWFWFKAYCITNCGYDFVSLGHGIDVLNCLLVLAPAAVLFWPVALASSRDDTQRWLALGTLGCAFLSVIWFPVLGYLNDWDIFAITPMAIAFHSSYVAADILSPRGFRGFAAAWIVGSAVHTASWWRYFHLNL